jgi:subtilisin family serine protease
VPRLLASIFCALVALVLVAPAAAQDAVPGELIVKFRPGADRADVLAHRRAAVRYGLGLKGVTLVRLQAGDSIGAAAAALERDPDVLYAEPNRIFHVHRTPNDPGYSELWGMDAISAPNAWDVTTGSSSVAVAVIDTGVSYTHPDLAANIWANPGEIASNGLDDDSNGRIDDTRGWDAADGDPNPNDVIGHGTHVAGTIGALGDNSVGVVGVNWQVSLMPLKIARDSDNALVTSAIIQAFDYACDENARVANGSFGGAGHHQPFEDAINACPGTLFVFSAGNGGDDDIGDDNDLMPQSPCTVNAPNVLCVAAADDAELTFFSNFGRTTVDLAAPGWDILSTIPAGYDYYAGTSMAAPHVAGAAALLAAHKPGLTAIELRNAVMNGVTPMSSMTGKVAMGGMLNVQAALSAPTTPPALPPPPPPPPPPPGPPPPPADLTGPTDPAVASTSHVPGLRSIDSTVEVTWSGAFDFGSGIDGFSFSWDSVSTAAPDTVKDVEETVTKVISPPFAPGTYWFHLRTRDNAGNWSPGTHAGPFVIAHAAVAQPQRCIVPRLKGKTLAAARTALKRAGCKLGPVKRVRSRVRKGRIVAQRPAAGRPVGKGTPVVVTISRGRR